MPALRKGGRPSRSSTTPHASPTSTPSDMKDRNQRSIMEWTEPSTQNPTPSFEEHGFARHGVLEQMAPLGQPPSAKVKQRTRAMGSSDAAARKTLAGKGSFLGDEDEGMPDITPAPELEPDDSERHCRSLDIQDLLGLMTSYAGVRCRVCARVFTSPDGPFQGMFCGGTLCALRPASFSEGEAAHARDGQRRGCAKDPSRKRQLPWG